MAALRAGKGELLHVFTNFWNASLILSNSSATPRTCHEVVLLVLGVVMIFAARKIG